MVMTAIYHRQRSNDLSLRLGVLIWAMNVNCTENRVGGSLPLRRAEGELRENQIRFCGNYKLQSIFCDKKTSSEQKLYKNELSWLLSTLSQQHSKATEAHSEIQNII